MYRYYLALRFMVSRPINLLGIVGVMLGVWALIVVVSIFSGYILEVKQHVNTVSADLVVVNLGNRVQFSNAEEILKADQNVDNCSPRLRCTLVADFVGRPAIGVGRCCRRGRLRVHRRRSWHAAIRWWWSYRSFR